MCRTHERMCESRLHQGGVWASGTRVQVGATGAGAKGGTPVGLEREVVDLVDVRDEPALARRVHLLVVGPQLALDGEEQHFQVPFLCEPGAGGRGGVRVKVMGEGGGRRETGTLRFTMKCPVPIFFS